MDLISSAKTGAAYVAKKTGDVACEVNRQFRHINTYRAAEHFLSRHTALGEDFYLTTKSRNKVLGEFDTHDQDKARPDWARKLQLAGINYVTADRISCLLKKAAEKDINNLCLLHEIRRTHDAVVGQRKNAKESSAYIRRAARKIHPDRTADLNGWEYPGVKHWNGHPPGYKYEHAKQGAAALFLLHQNIVPLLENKHYQRLLWTSAVIKGGALTVGDLARDVTLFAAIGVAYCLAKKRSMSAVLWASGASYTVLLAVHLAQLYVAYAKKKAEVKCRELVIYKHHQGATR